MPDHHNKFIVPQTHSDMSLYLLVKWLLGVAALRVQARVCQIIKIQGKCRLYILDHLGSTVLVVSGCNNFPEKNNLILESVKPLLNPPHFHDREVLPSVFGPVKNTLIGSLGFAVWKNNKRLHSHSFHWDNPFPVSHHVTTRIAKTKFLKVRSGIPSTKLNIHECHDCILGWGYIDPMKTRSIPHGKTLDMPPPLMMLHKTRAENPTLLTHKTVIKKLDVSKNRGMFPPKWMVKIMEKPMNKWDDLGVFPYFWKHPFTRNMFDPSGTRSRITLANYTETKKQQPWCRFASHDVHMSFNHLCFGLIVLD